VSFLKINTAFFVCFGHIDGSTCIHPQKIPKKLKFWKFFAIPGTGCINVCRAAVLGFGGYRCLSLSLGQHCCHCVAVTYLVPCALVVQSSPLWAPPPQQMVECLVPVNDRW
jgi:hypothetical protein